MLISVFRSILVPAAALILVTGLSVVLSKAIGQQVDPFAELPPGDYMAVLHVAPDGRDDQAGTADAPFATLERARDAVRAASREGMTGDIVVALAPGTYFLEETFVLTPEDSGRDGHRVRYIGVGAPGSARLIGGRRMKDWEPVDGYIFRARVPKGEVFHTLYENGLRARKARFPNYAFDARFPLSGYRYLNAADGTGSELVGQPGDWRPIEDMALGERLSLVFWPWGYCDWQKFTRRISGMEFDRLTISVEEVNPAIGPQARYYIEGAKDLLDQPGEFHLDVESGWLYYWPRFGHPEKQEIIAPAVRRILSIEGEDVAQPVRAVTLEGLKFAFTDTYAVMTGSSHFPWAPASIHGATGKGAHGALHLRYTEDIDIRFNHFKGAGMSAVFLDRSNKRNHLFGNWIEDAGVSGIVLAYHREARQFPADINEENVIENNLIHHLGAIGVDSAGVNIWGGRNNVVRYCEIFDGARYGVSIRGPYAALSVSNRERGMPHTNRPTSEGNRVSYSHLYRLGQDSGDMGAVHMAGISSLTHHPVNYFEQLLIEDIVAHPSMRDLAPNGIFFDYTEGVTDQVLRNIEIRGTRTPFRTNRTDFRHTFDNCSWRAGFDPDRMAYDRIGLRPDFPSHFGPPPEVGGVTVREVEGTNGERIQVRWDIPALDGLEGVWITWEGEPGREPLFVEAEKSLVEWDRPATDRLVMLRLQTENRYGVRSQGILIPGAEPPGAVRVTSSTGVEGGVVLEWTGTAPLPQGWRVSVPGPVGPSIEVPGSASRVELTGLQDGRTYTVRIDAMDRRGHLWPGTQHAAAAGTAPPIPPDMAGWWTMDYETVSAGMSLGDDAGRGNTLYIGNAAVESVEGRFGWALHFDGVTGYARALDGAGLRIGAGDYAISLWLRTAPSTAMAGRVLDFGGGTRGPWEYWGAEVSLEDLPAGGISIASTDMGGVSALFNDGEQLFQANAKWPEDTEDTWRHVLVNIQRDGDMTLWVNGREAARTDIRDAAGKEIQHPDTLYLGRYGQYEHPNLHWAGALDQVRIYQRALTAGEIMALYQETD